MQKRSFLGTILLLCIPPILIGAYLLLPLMAFAPLLTSIVSAIAAYIFIRSFGRSKHLPLIVLILIPSIYYISGLLPLSIRRNDFDAPFWWTCLLVMNAGILLGWLTAFHLFWKSKKIDTVAKAQHVLKISKALHVIGMITALIVLGKFGFIAIDPTRRFEISSFYLYSIEILISTTLMIIAIKDSNRQLRQGQLIVLILSALIALSMSGYRSQMVLLMVGIAIYYILRQVIFPTSAISRHLPKYGAAAVFFVLCMLAAGYYMRVELTGAGILDWDQRIVELEIPNAEFMLPLLPIHESARENIGVASIALQRITEIESLVSLNSFMWIELLTILPGFSQTATGILGQIVNRSATDFLTPGIIGGIYISHGMFGIFSICYTVALMFGLTWSKAIETRGHLYIGITAIMFVYYIHFMYRGIARPMYVIVIVYLLFIAMTSKSKKLNSHE